MSASKLDAVYRSILINKFFTKGWGKPENLRRLFEFRKVVSDRDECFKLIERNYPVTITKEQNLTDCKIVEGYFKSPLEKFLPGIVPEIAQKAHFQALLPLHWPDQNCKPVCLHLAGTGDHFFWRRRNLMAKPLLKEAAIGGIILENPFYGLRKPTDQVRSSLHNVSDIFVMGGCLILESLVLFHWCERNGFGPLGVTGLSMGGHMASLAATNWPKPLVLVPCLSWSTASAVFLQGVMSHSINWDLLEDQYLSDGIYREKLSKMVTIVDEAFLAGKKFAQTYSKKVDKDAQVPPDSTAISPHNELDITYKETENSENEVQKVSKISKIDNFADELKILLEDNKIDSVLYKKFTSDEKFELTPQDIENINKLSEEGIKEKLLNYTPDSKPQGNPAVISQSEPTTKTETKSTIHHTEDNTDLNNKSKTVEENLNITNNLTEKMIDREAALSFKTVNIITGKKQVKKSWRVSDFTSYLNFLKNEKKIDISKIHWRDREALQFMRGIMDECTHLSNFSVPFDTSLIIAVCAKHDAYVPREDVGTLEEIWPGAEVRYVDAGHVSAYILHQSLFRSCIVEAFERSKKKWKDGQHVA